MASTERAGAADAPARQRRAASHYREPALNSPVAHSEPGGEPDDHNTELLLRKP